MKQPSGTGLVEPPAPRLLAALPNARLRWLPGLSHVPISDDPAAVARLMIDFLTETVDLARASAR
jgi:pimeloyl-ACP methyl ester carboxylesterase